jgi:hypothetical protein
VLGTTWYQRGPTYWLLRALMSFSLLIALAFCLAPLSYAFWQGLRSEQHRPVSIALLVLAIIVSISAGVYMWRHSGYRSRPPTQPVPRMAAGSAAGVGAAAGTLARAGGIAAPFVVLGSILLVGPLTVLLVRVTFTRELASERRARERLLIRSG